eukprot:3836881-Rhodomonas_salina.2
MYRASVTSDAEGARGVFEGVELPEVALWLLVPRRAHLRFRIWMQHRFQILGDGLVEIQSWRYHGGGSVLIELRGERCDRTRVEG